MKNGANNGVLPVDFELQGETAVRYSRPAEQMAHEAGYDSLMTAQLFAYLRAISPMRIREAANRLFLYRSIEFVDIERMATEGVGGCSMFDLSRVTLLVAALYAGDMYSNEAPRLIAQAGAEYKWMDDTHILVVLRASGGKAVRQAAELAAQVHGVESWLPFEQWREMQVQETMRLKQNGSHRETAALPASAHSAAAAPADYRTPSASGPLTHSLASATSSSS